MKLLLLALVFNAPLALAEEGNFAQHKAKMLSHIEERIQKLMEHKNCVTSAIDVDALKACHQTMKAWRQDERMEFLEQRKARKESRGAQ